MNTLHLVTFAVILIKEALKEPIIIVMINKKYLSSMSPLGSLSYAKSIS